MRQLLVLSHGCLAVELVKSATMIVGSIENVSTISMTQDMGLDATYKAIETFYNEHDEDILVLADLYGGTPFNAAVMAKKARQNIEIVTGVNLGMIIEYATTAIEPLDELASYMQLVGKNGIQGQTYQFDDEEDEIDF